MRRPRLSTTPLDKPRDKDRLKETLKESNARTIEVETEKQPQVAADVADVFEGGCSHLCRFKHGFSCDTCDKYLEFANTFANFTKTTHNNERTYAMVTDVDATVARAKGEDFKNHATAKGWLGPNEAHTRMVHICIDLSLIHI